MIMWIILAYIVASCVASLIVYAACVAAARADKIQQHVYNVSIPHESGLPKSHPERSASARLALTI